ncbi:MAG: glycosyltransferase, partial [Caldilineaceae bacterium]|nr:glycosyltransferase [Caldilineaceae bacterium]
MTLYSLFVFGALMVMLTIALVNAASMPRLGRTVSGGRRAHPRDPLAPTVSILIPARNEARVIGRTLANLRAQSHPIREILVLDDQSEDGTASVVRAQAQSGTRLGHSPALRLLAGTPLPAGWGGKNWACHQLADAAVGDVLIFTDADVTWRPGALEAALSLLESSQADLLTVWPTQETVTWAERLIVPLMALAVVGYLPLPF